MLWPAASTLNSGGGSLLEIWSTQRLRPGDDRTLAPELWSVQVQLMIPQGDTRLVFKQSNPLVLFFPISFR